MESQFEYMFKVSFNSVTYIQDMGVETADDGIYHYVDIALQDVYSFDTFDNVWLDKNMYQMEILHRIQNTYVE